MALKIKLAGEKRQKVFERVKQLQATGLNAYQISKRIRGVSSATVYNWYALVELPPAPGHTLGLRYQRHDRRFGVVNEHRDQVSPEVADLRDRLVEAFTRGDHAEHGRLCLELRKQLAQAPLLQAAE